MYVIITTKTLPVHMNMWVYVTKTKVHCSNHQAIHMLKEKCVATL